MLISIPDDWAIPPEERKGKKKADELILKTIQEKKITYPAEIVGLTGLSRQAVFDRLAYLYYTEEKIERVNVLNHHPPPELKGRMQELWAMGLKGGTLKRMTWYRMKKEGKHDKSGEDQGN